MFGGQCKRGTPGPNQRSHGSNGAQSERLGLSYSTHVNKAFRPLCSRLGMTSVLSVRLWFITYIVLFILKLKWKRNLRVWSLSHVKHISLKRFLCLKYSPAGTSYFILVLKSHHELMNLKVTRVGHLAETVIRKET